MDADIDALRDELAEVKETVEEVREDVRSMRRSQRWHTIITIVWWLSVIGITGAAYVYYIQPYVSQVMGAYDNAKGFQTQVEDWFSQFSEPR